GRAAVYCANHQSNVDPPILFDKLHPRMHIVYKAEINAIPLLARAFRHGGFLMALKAQAPIVPVAIQGGRDAMRRGSRIIHPVRVSIRVGEPIETTGMDMSARDELIARVRAR